MCAGPWDCTPDTALEMWGVRCALACLDFLKEKEIKSLPEQVNPFYC